MLMYKSCLCFRTGWYLLAVIVMTPPPKACPCRLLGVTNVVFGIFLPSQCLKRFLKKNVVKYFYASRLRFCV